MTVAALRRTLHAGVREGRPVSGGTRMDVTPHMVCHVLRRLYGQPCTPPGTSRELVQHVQDQGLARFRAWPSGRWEVTPKGLAFLAENAEPACEED